MMRLVHEWDGSIDQVPFALLLLHAYDVGTYAPEVAEGEDGPGEGLERRLRLLTGPLLLDSRFLSFSTRLRRRMAHADQPPVGQSTPFIYRSGQAGSRESPALGSDSVRARFLRRLYLVDRQGARFSGPVVLHHHRHRAGRPLLGCGDRHCCAWVFGGWGVGRRVEAIVE